MYVYCESIEATFSIRMKNDGVKNHGYGTKAEILALDYAFHTLELKTVFADAIHKNKRTQQYYSRSQQYYSTAPLRTQQNFYFVAFVMNYNISPNAAKPSPSLRHLISNHWRFRLFYPVFFCLLVK